VAALGSKTSAAGPRGGEGEKGPKITFTIGDLSRLDHGLDEKAIVHRPIEEAARIT
jgi:hypothetical protein